MGSTAQECLLEIQLQEIDYIRQCVEKVRKGAGHGPSDELHGLFGNAVMVGIMLGSLTWAFSGGVSDDFESIAAFLFKLFGPIGAGMYVISRFMERARLGQPTWGDEIASTLANYRAVDGEAWVALQCQADSSGFIAYCEIDRWAMEEREAILKELEVFRPKPGINVPFAAES